MGNEPHEFDEDELLTGYRCYFLDDDGHIARRQELAVSDDASAAMLARQLLGTSPYQAAEVWDLSRLVDQLSRPAAR